MIVWFTSDQHYNHRNIIKYSGRPFKDIQEMEFELIRRHNEVVQKEDIVWQLGDFSLDERIVKRVLPQLNGKHILVPGNHDRCHPCHKSSNNWRNKYLEMRFEEVYIDPPNLYTTIFPLGAIVLLCHMPYKGAGDHASREGKEERYSQWRLIDKGEILLHGHVHECWKVNGRMINVGVDQWNYYPVSEDQISKLISLIRALP